MCGEAKEGEVGPDGGSKMEFDPDFKGPIQKRGCTDMICCILFIACSLAFLVIGAWSYTKGDPKLLLYPTDSEGNLCGFGDFKDRPYLFFFDMIDCARVGPNVVWMGCPTPQVCVSECPTEYWTYLTRFAEEQAEELVGSSDPAERTGFICRYDVDPTSNEYAGSDALQQLIEDEQCASYYLDNEPIAGRCIPAFISDAFESAAAAGDQIVDAAGNNVTADELESGTEYLAKLMSVREYGSKIFSDLVATWWMIIIGCVISALITFIWILLMRCTTGPMIWFSLIAFLLIFGAACYYSIDKYIDLRNYPDDSGTATFTTNLDSYTNLKETWLAFAIVTGVIFLVVLILMIFLRSRIRIAIAVIREAAKALKYMVSVLFFPLLPFIFMLVTIGYWAASAIFLASMGKADFSLVNKTTYTDADGEVQTVVEQLEDTVPCDVNANDTSGQVCNFLNYGGDEFTIYLQVFQVFMLLWILNWLVALTSMTMAGAFASYYWAFRKPEDIPRFPVLNAFVRSIFYHTGTMAFGALLLTLVQMIRMVLEYLDRKLKGKENPVAKFFLKCLKCCFWCLEKFIKFVNKNSYTMCAVYGKNFCRSAFMAFGLILRNIIRVAVVDRITAFVCFVGKLVCTAIAVFFAYLFFSGDLYRYLSASEISDYVDNYTPELNYYLVPVIVVGVAAYIIASAFYAVFSMGVDTIFMCFLQDIEVNDGTAEKPYFMSKELMGILGEKNDKEVEEAKKE